MEWGAGESSRQAVLDSPAAPDAGEPAEGRARRWWADPVLAGLVLLALGLRAWGIGAQSLWYDEWLTSEAVDGGLSDLLTHVADREGIPPPFFALVWLWTRVAGHGEVALRALPLVAGVATVPVAYALGRALRPGRAASRLAALLVAVNPMLVWYSQEARPYALLALVGGLSLLAAVRAGRAPDGDRRAPGWWALACAVAVAVHYFAAFLVVAEAAALVLARRERWRTWALALVPAGLVLAALAPVALRQHDHEANRAWITAFPLADRLSDAGRSALVGPSVPDGRLWLVAALAVAVALAAGGWAATGRERRTVAVAVGVGAGAVGLALVAVAVGVDAVVGRYLIAALPALLVAVAVASATALAGRRRVAAVAAGAAVTTLVAVSLVAVAAVATDADLQRPDWRAVAAAHEDAVAAGPAPRALVLNVHGNLAGPLTRYLDGSRVLEPGEVATVEAVDVVVARPADAPCNMLVGRACGLLFLGVPPPEPLFGRLEPDGRAEAGPFTVDRYRTRGPVDVTVADLVAPADRSRALVLVTG